MTSIKQTAGGILTAVISFFTGSYFKDRAERRYKYRLEAAMEYIFVDEKSGQYSDVSKKRQDKLKRHFRKRVFDVSA